MFTALEKFLTSSTVETPDTSKNKKRPCEPAQAGEATQFLQRLEAVWIASLRSRRRFFEVLAFDALYTLDWIGSGVEDLPAGDNESQRQQQRRLGATPAVSERLVLSGFTLHRSAVMLRQ
jgi:hypothetical protein